jgi:aarF domain-containing kinase
MNTFLRKPALSSSRLSLLLRSNNSRFYRTLSSPVPAKKRLSNKELILLGSTVVCCGGLGFKWYESDTQARHVAFAIQRMSIATKIGVSVAIDYKRTQLKTYSTEQEQLEAKHLCHLRCAERVLTGLQKLGGIYVKLGQHVSAMTYILPMEWTSTLSALQDRCDPTSQEDIEKLFLSDYGQPMQDVFEEFDWKPLGVASLAQVHKARLKKQHHAGYDDWVAVKFQHPRLDEFCKIDLQTVEFIIDTIKRIFPDFGFEWILQEMQESLPQEMNFQHEANNSSKVKKNFANEKMKHTTALVVPEVIWAKRRILVMECKCE